MITEILQQREKNLSLEYLKNGEVYLRVLLPNFTTQFHVISMRFKRCVATRQNNKILWLLNVKTLFILNISNVK